MLSLWMLDDARTLDAQRASHGSSGRSSSDAFRREKIQIRKSKIQKKGGFLKITIVSLLSLPYGGDPVQGGGSRQEGGREAGGRPCRVGG